MKKQEVINNVNKTDNNVYNFENFINKGDNFIASNNNNYIPSFEDLKSFINNFFDFVNTLD